MYPKDVAVIGDSFPNRLHNHLKNENKDCNLELDANTQAIVRWCAKGGLTLTKLMRPPMCFTVPHSYNQIAILHIGSNDLCSMSVETFINQLRTQTIPFLRDLNCTTIVLTQIFHRRPGKYTEYTDLNLYNAKVDKANQAMATLNENHVIYWEHLHVLRSGSINTIWHSDGVHLASEGMNVYWRSIRGAIITTIKSLNR